MPCCGRTPFEVPKTDRLTLDPKLVTCGTTEQITLHALITYLGDEHPWDEMTAVFGELITRLGSHTAAERMWDEACTRLGLLGPDGLPKRC